MTDGPSRPNPLTLMQKSAKSLDFSVVAIVAAYNEADIIERVVSDLIDQGIDVYFLDDGSTDGTVVAVEPFLGRGVIAIERLPDTFKDAAAGGFEWERILFRKAQLASELDASWFIHHDADEFRESPWPGVSLNAAIQRVDALGYNAIDFTLLDFWPVHEQFRAGDDVREVLTFYAPAAPYDRLQIRCWKKTDGLVDLASSGGHDVRFSGRKVFPLRFILRHYPIRGQVHGERKIFEERRTRFLERERARGWHVQYDAVQKGASVIRDASELTPYDADAVRLAQTLRHRGVEELEESLGAVRSEAATLHRELATRTEELGHRTEELAQTRADLNARAVEAAELRNTIDELRRVLDVRLAEIRGLQNAVADGARRLDELHRSLSWRWTAPARAAYRVLRGR